jgi:glycosyltransferase involved in cell wall biosynthesis
VGPLQETIRYARTTIDLVRSRRDRADVAFFFEFVPPPYGGGNQFLRALWSEFERRGLRLESNRISPTTRACLCNAFNFDVRRLRRFARDGCRIVHRVDGPVTAYRGVDDGTDRRVADINRELAQATVVQSQYSLERQRSLGFTFTKPRVIHNAADPAIFHDADRAPLSGGRRIRLISTSWSDNPNKGAAVYRRLESLLDWDRYEYTFVGRSQVPFDRIRTLPPQPSREVADLLRGHDIFVFASLHESCSNALVEALSCGLPAVYVDSGGNAELVCGGGVAFQNAEEIPPALERIVSDYSAFRARIDPPRLSTVADRYLEALGVTAS